MLPEAAPAKSPATVAAHKHVLADDGVKDASFALLRSQLLSAIERHDKSFIEEILSADILTELGGETGKANFTDQWQDLSPASPFWARLQRVLSHGAQYDSESNEYHAPAVSFDDSHSELPQAVVWNKNAGLCQSKDASPPIRLLYDQQVTVLEPSNPLPVKGEWAKIMTNNGSKGFMKSEDIYSAYDEFAVFKKLHGKWALTWFGFAGI